MSRRIIDLSWPIPDEYLKATSTAENPEAIFRYNGYICIRHEFSGPISAGTHFEIASHCVPDPKGLPAERLPKDDVFAADIPVERLYEMPATFIRLNRKGLDPKITAEELENALGNVPIYPDDGLLVQTQETACRAGDARSSQWRYMYFGREAVDWIVTKKIRLFGSDSWENHDRNMEKEIYTTQLFLKLWKIGAWCLVFPNNLSMITRSRIKLTVLPLPARTTVTTCRAVAVEEDE